MSEPSVTPSFDVFGDVGAACETLAARDPAFAHAVSVIGAPYIRRRPGGFEAIFRIIIEQQVSVPSAQAILKRCQQSIAPLTPQSVTEAGGDVLRGCGLSGPKVRYVMALADAIESGDFNLDQIASLDDDAALTMLQALKGIGPWTAAIYLLFCEGRSDIWPPRDVALLAAYRAARKAAGRGRGPAITMDGLDQRSRHWAPFRGVAAHILWTYYADLKGRRPI